jgi:hypothetical protein
MAITKLFAAPPPAPWEKESVEFMTEDLHRSGLVAEDMGAYPIAASKYSAPAYCIPYQGNDALYRVKINREENKYIATPGVTPDIWVPPSRDYMEMYDGDLIVVEGEKKAAAVAKYFGVPSVVGIGGCWNAVRKSEKNESYSLIERLQLLIQPGRHVHVILDGDVIDNKNVGRAALTLQSCIEALNASMTLYTPPSEFKGVDDWIYQDPKASFSGLVVVPFDKLAINRTLLYTETGCSLNDKGGLIHNELNGSKLLAHHFRSLGIVNDKRLGFIGRDRNQINPAVMHSMCLDYLQGDISPRYPAGAIGGAYNDYQVKGTQYDLVQEFVKALKWDGVPRLETWGSEYLQSKQAAPVVNEWGRLLFTGLVLRILVPGTKVDTVSILNGKQGIGKTTFFEDLATIDGFNFYRPITDLPGSTGDDRTFKQTITASLVVDLGEGIIFESKKTSSDRLKQFLTERADEYRVAYAKNNTITPRGFIFVGTTNRGDQLSDLSGSRRFFYLNVQRITRIPYEIRLQIMAEVAAREEEIRASHWYDLRVTMDDMDQGLKDENPHITDVRELLNVEHYRPDSLTESIKQLIESGTMATHKETGEILISANYITTLINQDGQRITANMVSRKFTELTGSPQFPYTFEWVKYRLGQVIFHSTMQETLYKGFVGNSQGQFVCYIVRRK